MCRLLAVLSTCLCVGYAQVDLKYNTSIASIGLDLANAAYCEPAGILDFSCGPCKSAAAQGAELVLPAAVYIGECPGVGPVKSWGTQAYVALLSNERIVISFRGSANLINWLYDRKNIRLY